MRKNKQEYEQMDCGVKHYGDEKFKKCHFILMKDDHSLVMLNGNKPFRTLDEIKAVVQFNNISGFHIEHKINQFSKENTE